MSARLRVASSGDGIEDGGVDLGDEGTEDDDSLIVVSDGGVPGTRIR